MSVLVIAEHDGVRIRTGSRSALAAARRLADETGETVELMCLGQSLDALAADGARYAPVIVADHPCLRERIAERDAPVIAAAAQAREASVILAAATTYSRDVLPRVAALLDGAMAGDVLGWSRENGRRLLRRPVYAGAATATVELLGAPAVITIRPSVFPPMEASQTAHPAITWPVEPTLLPASTEYLGLESKPIDRPELTEARVVVSGGRALRDAPEFERYVGALADALHGAVGCTRALVDAGITPNEWQVGQTGKLVAPELYIAVGLSGAIQHIAGMKNSRVVVAINSDPTAPIFGMANYGLVGDVRELVPQLIDELRREA
jgi:electron transfer flavoprotein alpha subunit